MKLAMFRRQPCEGTIRALYGAIVAQARSPTFYQAYGVPDTTTGRFEMIVLHQVLVLRRLAREGEEGRRLGQGVFDTFCRDMDDNLRELGVGDLAVPKAMQRMAEVYYGRAVAYDRALAGNAGAPDRGALAAAIGRTILDETGTPSQAAVRLADYVLAAVHRLAGASRSSVVEAALPFPDPCEIAATAEPCEPEP